MDFETLSLVGSVLLVLCLATTAAAILNRFGSSGLDHGLIERLYGRVKAWWLLFAALAGAFLVGKAATVFLFGLLSFWALREFITVTPTRQSDHRTLFWVFFVCLPLQFVLVGLEYYDLYSTLIPVYAFLLIPARIALSGDHTRFLERTAKIQAGLLICVYCLSFAPALLTLKLPEYSPQLAEPNLPKPTFDEWAYLPTESEVSRISGGEQTLQEEPNFTVLSDGATPPRTRPELALIAESSDPVVAIEGTLAEPRQNTTWAKLRLLLFFVLMVQLSDILQYLWSKLPSKHIIAPTIHPSRTWEGFLGGSACVMLVGTALWFATPFPYWWQASVAALVTSIMAFAGSMTMSAIKRDRGVRDYGILIEGHGGVLDRIDSMCFAAPVFFHLSRYFLAAGVL